MTNVVLNDLVRTLSESIARSLLKEYGNSLTDDSIVLKTAGTLEALYDLDATEIVNLTLSYVQNGSVHVEIPTWRINQDGTVKTEDDYPKEIW